MIEETLLSDFAVNEAGQRLSGFRIGPDNPFGVTYCGLPTEQAGLEGDVDLSLYTAPGMTGAARPLVSLFHRPEGWSSLGTGETANRRLFKKGGFNAMFTQPYVAMGDQVTDVLDYLRFQKFYYFNDDFLIDGAMPRPEFHPSMTVAVSTHSADTLEHGNHRIVVQMGNHLLLEHAKTALANRNVTYDLSSGSSDGFVYGGTYPSGRPFLWFSLYDDERRMAALVEIEAKTVPDDLEAAVAVQDFLACSFNFLGHALQCQYAGGIVAFVLLLIVLGLVFLVFVMAAFWWLFALRQLAVARSGSTLPGLGDTLPAFREGLFSSRYARLRWTILCSAALIIASAPLDSVLAPA